VKHTCWRRRICREDGAAAIEFALVLPLLLILVFGIIDFGRLLFTANTLTSAVREGARFASVQEVLSEGDVRSHMAPYLSVALGGSPVDQNTIVLSDAVDAAGVHNVTVRITEYTFTAITPFANLVGMGSVTLSPEATFRWERAPAPPTTP
jgi:Flp pilus assembly protein TadG